MLLNCLYWSCAVAVMAQAPDFASDFTKEGTLPPWEVAKTFAFAKVLEKIESVLGEEAHIFLGMAKAEYIASQVHLKGGGSPTPRTIQKTIALCRDPEWYPGKRQGVSTGRPPIYSDHVKYRCAQCAMELKRKSIRPTPRRVRARFPNLTLNPQTSVRMSDTTMQQIFSTLCYDEHEDDPWQYLPCVSQDVLGSELLPKRVACARHIQGMMAPTTWYSFIGIDPCYSLLPKTLQKLEHQQVKAMGKMKWYSKRSARKGNNPRAPSTTGTQSNESVRVDWSPVYARGKLRLVAVDSQRALSDPQYPAKLTDSFNLGKFIRHVLPGVLQDMAHTYGWSNLPRTVVHDKASYMVTNAHERLNVTFASALEEAGFTSWIGGNHESTSWLAAKWGDVYLHETVISHVRRLLDTVFTCTRLGETPMQFARRLKQVEDFMNSDEFAKEDGGRGLLGLAKDFPARCQMVIDAQGARIPK